MTVAAPDFLNVAEVAARLRVTQASVRRWLREGKINGISLGSDRGGWRIPLKEVERVETEGFQRPTP